VADPSREVLAQEVVQFYSDAVAVFQEGRENPDFYLMASPSYVLFMINWAESQT